MVFSLFQQLLLQEEDSEGEQNVRGFVSDAIDGFVQSPFGTCRSQAIVHVNLNGKPRAKRMKCNNTEQKDQVNFPKYLFQTTVSGFCRNQNRGFL